MRYELVLFDLDDTLLDFSKTQRASFDATLTRFEIDPQAGLLFETYCEISRELWAQYERGELEKSLLRTERFARLLIAASRTDIDVEEISAGYLDELPNHPFLIDGALDVCRRVAESARVGVVTNGFASVQHRRVAASPLGEHFHFVLTSEEVGTPKPARPIFERALAMGEADAGSTVMIGDTWSSDIRGAIDMGIDALWFNAKGAEGGAHDVPELRELERVFDHLH